mgnify:CR=1 FL=1
MIAPLFTQGQRARLPVITAAVASRDRVLVRTYESVNVATTTAAKYNARYGEHGIEFNVRRSEGDPGDPAAGMYGVYAYKAV